MSTKHVVGRKVNRLLFIIAFAGALVLANAAPPTAPAQTPSVLLEKGIYNEETVGDLDAAIGIYQQILEQVQADRAVAAQALLRIGSCQLKKGQTEEAAKTLERLSRDYPEQSALAAEAQKLTPAPAFPELMGARLKESLTVAVGKPGATSSGAGTKTIYGECYLEITAHLDSETLKKGRSFAVVARPAQATVEDKNGWLWSAFIQPPRAPSILYGADSANSAAVAPSDENGLFETKMAPAREIFKSSPFLKAGEYVVAAYAFETETSEIDIAKAFAAGEAKLVVMRLPYTQISIDDIQPNGVIRFRSITGAINKSDLPLTENSFINSDFVKLEKMSDEFGRPIHFTSKHEGNIYRYRYELNQPVEPGQPDITCSEGYQPPALVHAVKGVKDEFYYSMRHFPGANETRRMEIYRLPQGAELLATTPENMARREKDGCVELFVDKIIPSGGNIFTSFTYRLVGASLGEPLVLESAPWKDGEEMRLPIVLPSGVEAGTLAYRADLIEQDGKRAWKIHSEQNVPSKGDNQITDVVADEETFAPATGYTKSLLGEFSAEYTTNAVNLTVKSKGQEATRHFPVDQTVYDNEQALFLIRRMPLKKGYHASFPIFSVQSGVVVECRIDVTGEENVTVPKGTFPCYKVTLEIYSGEIRALQHFLWFSADDNRYLVKYDSGVATMQLTDIQ